MNFSDFRAGQYVSFERSFGDGDFERFRVFSWDANPLHADHDYARASEIGERIVPLALAVSPFSAIAGMAVPGRPSLILSQSYDAHRPVRFDRTLTFSAKIEAILPSQRSIRLALRVFDGTERLIAGQMDVQARVETWDELPNVPTSLRVQPPDRTALVTGADGAVGSASATRLERAGWRVIRHSRRGTGEMTVRANFCEEADLRRFEDAVRTLRPSLVVHCASARVDGGTDALVATNFTALRAVARAALPGMCARQTGLFVAVGSIAQIVSPLSMVDYAAAKAQSGWYLRHLRQVHGADGIQAVELLCDKVDTAFSEGIEASTSIPLDPEEVADAIVALVASSARDLSSSYRLDSDGIRALVLEPGHDVPVERPIHHGTSDPISSARRAAGSDTIEAKLRTVFDKHLPASTALTRENVTVHRIPDWDSLKQIILALEVENVFGIALGSSAISSLSSFDAFHAAISSALASATVARGPDLPGDTP